MRHGVRFCPSCVLQNNPSSSFFLTKNLFVALFKLLFIGPYYEKNVKFDVNRGNIDERIGEERDTEEIKSQVT